MYELQNRVYLFNILVTYFDTSRRHIPQYCNARVPNTLQRKYMLRFPHINISVACRAEGQRTNVAQSTFVLMKAASGSPSTCYYCKAALSSIDVLKGDMSTCANIERSTRVVYTWTCPQN